VAHEQPPTFTGSFGSMQLLMKDLMAMAVSDPASKLNGRKLEEIRYRDGKLFVIGDEQSWTPMQIS